MMPAGLLLTAALAVQSPDTATYADLATLEIMQMARERHRAQDTLVSDYAARLLTRTELRAGRSRFARLIPLWVQETIARVAWRKPNQLNLEIEGTRARSVFPTENVRMGFSEPWFVPRALGDSVRLIGIPETAALHPLAADAEAYYQYAITDSSQVSVPGRTVRAVAVRVTPRDLGPSVVAGELWLDRATGDVVRLSVTFLGEYVWSSPEGDTPEDSTSARRDSHWAQRFLTVQADLEYSLVDNRFWMPWRQLLAITAHADFIVSAAMPARILTTFSDYTVNANVPVAFAFEPDSGKDRRTVIRWPEGAERVGGDSARDAYGFVRTGSSAGMRWEITVPPAESLHGFAWSAPLETDLTDADRHRVEQFLDDIERFAESLPDDWMSRPRFSMAVDRLPDILRFNRVQGVSVGAGVVWRPGLPFTTVRTTAAIGLSDLRPLASVTLRREAPTGQLNVGVFRRVAERDPWTRGLSLGNSINAVFTGHDDAHYHLALGGRASWEFYRGPFAAYTVTAGFERQRSMVTASGSAINDFLGGSGVLAPNPAIAEGGWLTGRLERRLGGRLRGTIGAESMYETGGAGQGMRAWVDSRLPFQVAGRTGALSVRAGTGAGDPIPQLAFALGGPQTVRGYPYGFASARSVWAAQLDVALRRRWTLTPVLSADVGDTDFRGEPLVSVGAGLSLFSGWMRLNLAKGLNPSQDVRFDLLFSAPR